MQLGPQGKLIGLTHERNEIEQAIRIIIMTAPGQRVMRPDFGCRIHELVFAPNNEATAVQASRFVEEALARWEPRIEQIVVKARPAYETADYLALPHKAQLNRKATLLLEISYRIKYTDDPRSLVFPFYLIPEE
jgi:phage baseplate assembly protein W